MFFEPVLEEMANCEINEQEEAVRAGIATLTLRRATFCPPFVLPNTANDSFLHQWHETLSSVLQNSDHFWEMLCETVPSASWKVISPNEIGLSNSQATN